MKHVCNAAMPVACTDVIHFSTDEFVHLIP